ncbi:MAG: alanine--tRNA ligase [Candidatus Omnitrophica bacterium]|nr:alanine--tRNA ligase [Candidatus Omnitrophota bacterium]
MTTNDIRTKFLNFFKSKHHSIIPSDSLVPKDDPTVLFTTAGMQQFKPQFLGHLDGFSRAATCQKCLRTDDLDVVGKTDFHHTFFEMLGNFSFGGYFKKEAILWAWEFLTHELRLPPERLWVSVYQDDDEAHAIWADKIKVPVDRIVKLGDKSNFWPSNARQSGPNGPCGPCSEIFYDYGTNMNCPKGDDCDPDCSCGRFSEVWNLVFTQFNRKDGGILEPLPAKNIDTGMGLERLAAVVQGKKSNYETDNFSAILKIIKDTFEFHKIHASESEFRIIADHMRAVVIGISDGVVPSNEGRGYVMKKLIVDMSDLAIRAGIETPVIYTFVDIVIERLKEPYPELKSHADETKEFIKRIEEAFIKVRRQRVPELKDRLLENKENANMLGEILFLYRDTHGLTLSTMMLAAQETGISVSLLNDACKIFEAKMEEQKNRSRKSSKMIGDVFADQNFALNLPKTEFAGYAQTRINAQVLKILNDEGEIFQANQGEKVKIILNCTPFYAQAGGQIGDTGYLSTAQCKVRVTDTCKANDIYIHSGIVERGTIRTGENVGAQIDESRRGSIMRNHTATHLLQAALREVLGSHVKQQGSLVEDSRLRFDFTHPSSVGPQQLQKIQHKLDQFIRQNDKVATEVLTLEEAKKKGALAFFAEKYGETVRVISIGDYSKEFCGGTHVSSTGQIEAVLIVSEGSVAQGIRRMEALTGTIAVDHYLKSQEEETAAVKQAWHAKQLEKEKQDIYFDQVRSSVDEIIASAENIKGVKVVLRTFQEMDVALLRKLSDLLKQKAKSGIFVLSSKGPQDACVVLSLTDDLVARGIKANELMQRIAPLLDGSGGGRANLAQAGSKQPQKLDGALLKAKEIIGASIL